MYKKKFLLCTIAGTLIFSHFSSAYAETTPLIYSPKVDASEGEKTVSNANIRDRVVAVNASGQQSSAMIENATITSELLLFSATKGARINAKAITGKTMTTGLQIGNSTINLEDSIITVKGNHEGYGIVFESGAVAKNSEAVLTNSKIFVKDGIGIFGASAGGNVRLKNSEIHADMLLKNVSMMLMPIPSTLTLTADHSILKGKARTSKEKTTILTLNNDSKWFVTISEGETDNDTNLFNYLLRSLNDRAHSSVSVLNLKNSSIIFNKPIDDQYQTLSVGRSQKAEENSLPGLNLQLPALPLPAAAAPQQAEENPRENGNEQSNVEAVYNAVGDARIYANLKWSNGAAKDQQKADRFLVYGDVSGTTTLYLNTPFENKKTSTDNAIPLNTRGLSLVQVSGKTDENAFKLAKGYATMSGLPYKYVLRAYGPTSSLGKANAEQNVLGEGDDFWDFRLQNAYLDSEAKIKALVPQVASYLVMPSALFSAGLADINNQNTLLTNVIETEHDPKENKKQGVFASVYGNKVTLSSHRDPHQYGYGADVQYTALQAGVMLSALEDKNIAIKFGLLGTYGKLDFTPKDMENSGKSMFDKWSLTAYSNIQHSDSIYVNAFFSYGTLNGNITTGLTGNTAKIDDTKILNASATIGQKLTTGVEGLVFEPQAQLIYQNLMLDTITDVDGFEVNMGKPHQWLVRAGGRLVHHVPQNEKGRTVSFYGKLNALKAFGDDGSIKIGDTFHRDSMGSSIEGGIGINAQLSQTLELRGDVSYQHKLQKAGISGVNFSGIIRYRF
ncbi:autotransporter outer membrane beta-barrel domain-containing protein [Bartonella sp. CB175]|uniref:autotransporter outer membrane beta-barrel domain-containing protein n=1 Tax=Bartonella sp. CB175 TaxID=3112256 RepID=UPI00300E3ADE